jgi:hypothetical protein
MCNYRRSSLNASHALSQTKDAILQTFHLRVHTLEKYANIVYREGFIDADFELRCKKLRQFSDRLVAAERMMGTPAPPLTRFTQTSLKRPLDVLTEEEQREFERKILEQLEAHEREEGNNDPTR